LQEFLSKYIFFDAIKNQQAKQIDLHVHELFIDDIGVLKNTLTDESFSKKIIYTKNKTTIDNFLRYNSIESVQVFEARVK